MLAGDGIYSRYLQHHLTTGRYKFTIFVDDNENSAFYVSTSTPTSSPKPKKQSQDVPNDYAKLMLSVTKKRCCGSTVEPALQLRNFPDKEIKTGIFRRQATGPVVHIESLPYPDPNMDYLPPSKIGDFRISPIPNTSNKLLATWTAPGGDYSAGMVASYKFVMSDDIADLLKPKGNPRVLLGFDRLEQSGTRAKFDFSFPHFDQDYYLGIYSFDASGNRGKISNLVHVRIPSPPGPPSPGTAFGDLLPALTGGTRTEPNWIMIGAIAGVLGMLLLLGIVIIAYYFAVTRGKKRNGKTGSTSSVIMNGGGSSDETDSSSFDSDIKNIMANPLGPTLPLSTSSSQTQRRAHHHPGLTGPAPPKAQAQAPPSQGSTPSDHPTESTTVTPVYWSASQLLSKLDHNTSGLPPYPHYHGNPYINSSADLYGSSSSGHYVPNGPHSLQLSPANLHHVQTVQNQPNSLHNSSFPAAAAYHAAAEWPGYLHHASAVMSDYQHHSEIPEEYTITVGNLNHESSDPDPAKGLQKPRNITQV